MAKLNQATTVRKNLMVTGKITADSISIPGISCKCRHNVSIYGTWDTDTTPSKYFGLSFSFINDITTSYNAKVAVSSVGDLTNTNLTSAQFTALVTAIRNAGATSVSTALPASGWVNMDHAFDGSTNIPIYTADAMLVTGIYGASTTSLVIIAACTSSETTGSTATVTFHTVPFCLDYVERLV